MYGYIRFHKSNSCLIASTCLVHGTSFQKVCFNISSYYPSIRDHKIHKILLFVIESHSYLNYQQMADIVRAPTMCKAPRHGDTTFGKNQVAALPSAQFHRSGAVQTPARQTSRAGAREYPAWKLLTFHTVCSGRTNNFEMNSDRSIFNGNSIIFRYYAYYFLADHGNCVDI